jgi:protein involved in polysaccharide export with SLBB domain
MVAAGGLRYDADLEHVKIKNKFDGSVYEVNLLELVQNGDSDQDMFLVAGDSVEVPKLPTSYAMDEQKYRALLGSSVFQKEIPVKIYGFVNKPGLVMLDSAQSANLNSAIGMAGGYLASDASYAPGKVMISRVDASGHLSTVEVDPRREDMTLRPNDIVYVPSKLRPKVGRAFDYMARMIQPAAFLGSAVNNWTLLFDPTRFQINMSTR